MKYFYLIAMTFALTGCVTLTNKAKKVQPHNSMSSLLEKCKNLGPVDGTGSAMWSVDTGIEQAKVSIRENAFDKGADTVVILNNDHTFGEINLQGTALKCYDNK